MATKISNVADLFHRFHACELYVKQGKIAASLIAFKEVCERMPAIALNEKEKKELNENIELFLNNLSAHKKFKEIFGEFSFGDTDLATNLEFIKSMITAQEEEIIQKVERDERAAEAQRLEIEKEQEKKKEDIKQKIQEAITFIDESDMPQADELMRDSEEIREAIIIHYNTLGMENRETKNFTGAVANYQKAIAVSPQDENLHYNLARTFFEEGKSEKAEASLDKALKINPEFSEGKVFYDYLLKLNKAKPGTATEDKKKDGFFKKIFSGKK